MKHVCALTLLLLCSISVGISVKFDVVVPSGPVYGLAGEDMLLPCVLEPRLSAEGMDVEWVTDNGGVVHVYKNKTDSLDEQHESYRGRTELFREELRAGNVSLKLSSVRVSDANTYWCVVNADGRLDDAKLKVIVNAVGSQPNITIESHLNGSASLVCQSEGWYPEPSIEWLTSAGMVLPSGPVESSRTRNGFTVSRRVVVQESDGRVKCRVSSQRQTKEADAPQILFSFSRHRWATGAAAIAAIAAVALLLAGRRLKIADVQDYKKWIKTNFNKVQEYKSLNDMLLDKQYVDLLIAETSVEQHERENKSQPILDSLHQVQSQKNFPMIGVRDFFRPNKDGSVPNAVVLLGESGYGKSVISKKILHRWASGCFSSDRFDLVLLLKCDVLNQETSGASGKSLVELASSDQRFRPMVEKMLKESPERVLLIIDGLDELNLSEETSCPSGESENWLFDLLRRHQRSSLLITTRCRSPGSLDKLIKTRRTRFTEILGFTEKGVECYFQKFFKDQQNFEDAFRYVRGNEMLFTYCCIPVICWIVCTVLKISKVKGDVDTMKTTTSIFVHVVSTLLKHHKYKKSELQSLCALAEMGTKNNKVLFEKDEISNVGLNPDSNPFLHKLHLQEKYSFIHLSFQEFFTALNYTMVSSTEAVMELLSSVSGQYWTLNRNPKPQHLSVIRFLLGLSNCEVSGREKLALEDLSATVPAHQEDLFSALKDWFHEKMKKPNPSEITLFLLHCLYELHEEEFLKRTLEGVRSINLQNSSLKRRDCWVLQYCLRCCRSIAQLNLRGCNLTADGFRLLKPVLSQLNCNDLRFDVEGLGDGDFSKFLEGAQEVLKSRRRRAHVEGLGDGDFSKFLEGAQEVLKSRPVKRDQLGQHDECDGSEVPEKPQRKSVSIHLSCMKSVGVSTVSGILDIFRESRVDLDLEISAEVDGQKCSNETTDLSYLKVKRDKDSFMLTVEQYENSSPAPAPAVSLITLTLLPSEGLRVEWEEFLQIFNSINVSSTGACERTQLDQHVPDLVSLLPRNLTELTLKVSRLTEVLGKRILTLFQDHPEPLDIRVWTTEGRDSDGNSLCSTLSLTKAVGNYRLRVIYDVSEEVPGLSAITVVLPNIAELTPFQKKFILSKRLTEESQLDEDVPNLLSLLPNLRELKLEVRCLTQSWAHRIFSLVRVHCSEEKFSVCVEAESTSPVDNLCSVLSLEKHNSSLRVTVENAVCSSELPSSTPLSHLSVMAHSENLNVENWVSILGTFHNLSQPTDSGDRVDGHMDALLSSLRVLGNLQQVKLHINCLSETWATWTLSLKEACPSLEKIMLSAGLNALACNRSRWIDHGPLETRGIDILNAQKGILKNCHIELRGIKTPAPQGVNQGRPVTITISGEDYKEEDYF